MRSRTGPAPPPLRVAQHDKRLRSAVSRRTARGMSWSSSKRYICPKCSKYDTNISS